MNFWAAFTAGFLSFFSPCFIPLIPVYLIYITGSSLDEIKEVKLHTMLHSLCFILGFTIVFTSLGAAASLLGRFFIGFGEPIRIIAGLLIIILGLYLMRLIKLPFLDIERKITVSSKPIGYLGSIVVGMAFALGWSPCAGPVLAAILIYAGQSNTVWHGIMLLITFSLGLGLPLLLVSAAVNYSLMLFKKIEKYLGAINLISGIFLVIIGLRIIWDSLNLIK